jgi:DNA repair exonuclease SbcCD ATPase subunit
MKIQSIKLENFMTYHAGAWSPVDGVTLLTGDNGAGKSTMMEAMCWALYGETLRGKSPVPPGAKSASAQVNFTHKGHDWAVGRTRNKQTATILLTRDGEDLAGQTATETQTKIENLLGPWARFTATRLFAKEFLAKFGASTDKERKELLESFLGLERFGEAADVLKVRLREASDRQMQLDGQAFALTKRIAAIEAQPALKATRPLDAITAEKQAATEALLRTQDKKIKLKELLAATSLARDKALKNLTGAQARTYDMKAALTKLDSRVLALQVRDQCPTCLQAIEEAAKARIVTVLGEDRLKQSEALAELLGAIKGFEEELSEVEGEKTVLDARGEALNQEAVTARTDVERLTLELREAELVAQMRAARDKDTTDLEAEQAVVAAELAKIRTRVAVLGATAEVYGLRGARHMLLGRALKQIEHATNQVLGQLGLDLKVGISATAQLKSGKAIDAISFQVIGAGGGEYGGASSGERSRVDVALLLALAQLLGPDAEGFVAFDEVFDALDRDGIARVASYLEALGQGRQVLVITHNPEVQTLFPRSTVMRAVKDDVDGSRLEAV